MGIIVFVDIEGAKISPISERTDGKPLAHVVTGWIWYPEVVNRLGISEFSLEVLRRVDDTNWGGLAKDVWQDPQKLLGALKEVHAVFGTIRSDPYLIDESFPTQYFDFDISDYQAGIEDAIKVCELAVERDKRVALKAH